MLGSSTSVGWRLFAESDSRAAAASATGKTIIAGFGSGPDGLDFDFNHALRSLDIYRNCGISPLAYTPKKVGEVYEPDFTKLVGNAAKERKVAPDYRSITITLKEGLKSSVGNELTADDVIWMFRRHHAVKGVALGFEQKILFLSTAENVKKKGKYSYTIHIDKPNVLIEPIMAHIEMQLLDSTEYQKHATKDDPWATKWSATHFVGHGPYKLTEYKAGQSWTIEPNPYYTDTGQAITGNAAKVVSQVIPQSASRVALMQAGTIDLAFDLGAAELRQLQKGGMRIDNLSGNFMQWLGFTFGQDNPLSDLNVRQAIRQALPLDELVRRPYLGIAKQMDSLTVPSYPGYDIIHTAWNKPKLDLAAAKDLLSKSKYPKGFKTTLHFDAGVLGQEETAIIVKSALAEIAIDVELKKLQTSDYFQFAYAVGGGFPGLFLYRDFAGTPDPLFGTGLFVISGHCCSPGKYGNPEIDKMYEEAQSTFGNNRKRYELQRQIEDIMWNKDPFGVPLDFTGFQVAAKASVTGWTWDSINEILWHKAVKQG
jgi:peptide/nickel transport system substrate-binding protein